MVSLLASTASLSAFAVLRVLRCWPRRSSLIRGARAGQGGERRAKLPRCSLP